jgi:hypothetical protein
VDVYDVRHFVIYLIHIAELQPQRQSAVALSEVLTAVSIANDSHGTFGQKRKLDTSATRVRQRKLIVVRVPDESGLLKRLQPVQLPFSVVADGVVQSNNQRRLQSSSFTVDCTRESAQSSCARTDKRFALSRSIVFEDA